MLVHFLNINVYAEVHYSCIETTKNTSRRNLGSSCQNKILEITIRRRSLCEKEKQVKVDRTSITSIVSDDLEQSTGGHEQGIIPNPRSKTRNT